MTLDDLWARFKVIDSLNGAKNGEMQLSNHTDVTYSGWMHCLRIDREKATINGLYKVVHWLSIAEKMCYLEWPLREIQGHWFLKCHKNGEIQLSNDSDAIEAFAFGKP